MLEPVQVPGTVFHRSRRNLQYERRNSRCRLPSLAVMASSDRRYETGLTCEAQPPHTVITCAVLLDKAGQAIEQKITPGRDQLVAIDDTPVESLDLRNVPHLLYGPCASLVKLTLKSNDTLETYVLHVRRSIPRGIWRIYSDLERFLPSLLKQIATTKREISDQAGNPRCMYSDNIPGQGATLGINLGDERTLGTLQVKSVCSGSPADLAGVFQGDQIVSVDGKTATKDNVQSLISPSKPRVGSTCKLALERAGRTFFLEVQRSPKNCIEITQALMESIIEIRASAQDVVPEGWARDMILRKLDGLVESVTCLAQHRIDSEKNIASKIESLQQDWLGQINQVHSALVALPSPEYIGQEIDRYIQASASLTARLGRLEEINEKLSQDCDRMDQEMREMSSELTRWKNKGIELSKRQEEHDMEQITLQSRIIELEAKVRIYDMEFPRTVSTGKIVQDEKHQLQVENHELRGSIAGIREVKKRYETEMKSQKEIIDRLMDECLSLRSTLDTLRPFHDYCERQEPRIEVMDFMDSVRSSGLRAEEIIRLMGTLRRLPPPVVGTVETISELLRGPPRLSLYDLREMVLAYPELREQTEGTILDAAANLTAMQRERTRRQELEKENNDLSELAHLAQRALEEWKPMIDYNKHSSPPISPHDMAIAMHTSGVTASDLVTLLNHMSGPPSVPVPQLCDVIKVCFSSRNVEEKDVRNMWKRLKIQRLSWGDAVESKMESDFEDSSRRFKESIQFINSSSGSAVDTTQGFERQPSDSTHSGSSRNLLKVQKKGQVSTLLTSYEARSRLKTLLSSHHEYIALTGDSRERGGTRT
jgi:hypothetical protein